MKRQLQEAAERKRLENETRFQKFKRHSKHYASLMWEKLKVVISASISATKKAVLWTGSKIKDAWDWHCKKCERSALYTLATVGTFITGLLAGMIMAFMQGDTPYDIYDEKPINTIVLVEDRCWFLYDQTAVEENDDIEFHVGGQRVRIVKEYETSRFKGTEWGAALSGMGRSDVDPETCVKDGKVFK